MRRFFIGGHWFGLMLVLAGCSAVSEKAVISPDPQGILRRAADRVLQGDPAAQDFNWGGGVLMAGMMQAGIALDEPAYVAYVRSWADSWRERYQDDMLKDPYIYCGFWVTSFPLYLLYEQTGEPRYLEMGRWVMDFMLEKGGRCVDHGLGIYAYYAPHRKQLWLDTLYMACPGLAEYARLSGQRKYVEEAARQLVVHARYLQDEQTGLFHHMYDERAQDQFHVFWGRGNGWVTMSCVEVLRRLDRESPWYEQVEKIFQNQIRGLRQVQDARSGMWHTVLDRPETYLETSASAMFLYGLREGMRLGILDEEEYIRPLRKTWSGLAGRINEDGVVEGVSIATPALKTWEDYADIGREERPWGTGAFLMAASVLVSH